MLPCMPMPLPVTVDFTVTSANAGATGAMSATSARSAKRFIRVISTRGNPILLLLRWSGSRLRPLVCPVQHLGHHVQDRFARRVAMRLERQRDVSHRRTVPLQCPIEALRLDRIGARVVVSFTVDQQDRLLDLVGE